MSPACQDNAATSHVAVELKTRVGDSSVSGKLYGLHRRSSQSHLRILERQILPITERLLADESGGQAFYRQHDIRAASIALFDDGRYAYTSASTPIHGHGTANSVISNSP